MALRSLQTTVDIEMVDEGDANDKAAAVALIAVPVAEWWRVFPPSNLEFLKCLPPRSPGVPVS